MTKFEFQKKSDMLICIAAKIMCILIAAAMLLAIFSAIIGLFFLFFPNFTFLTSLILMLISVISVMAVLYICVRKLADIWLNQQQKKYRDEAQQNAQYSYNVDHAKVIHTVKKEKKIEKIQEKQ